MKEPTPQPQRPEQANRNSRITLVPMGPTAEKPTPRKYVVLNLTDGIAAHPVPVTLSSAQRLVRQFPRRFLGQGFYVTAERKRIRPEDVRLVIVDAEPKAARSHPITEPKDFAEKSTKTGLDKASTPDAPVGCKL